MRFGRGLWRHPAKLLQAVQLSGSLVRVPRYHDAWPVRAEGRDQVERLVLSVGGHERTLDVDYVACAFGFAPVTGLAALLGCAIEDARVKVDGLQRTTVEGVLCAGESTGIAGADCARAEGVIAGHMAAGREDLARIACRWRDRERRFGAALTRTFALRNELRALPTTDTIVCRCEDVAWGALVSHEDERDAKLQTRTGMGPCQGRVCGAALEFLKGWPRSRVRPPLIPVTMDVLAEVGAARHHQEESTS